MILTTSSPTGSQDAGTTADWPLDVMLDLAAYLKQQGLGETALRLEESAGHFIKERQSSNMQRFMVVEGGRP